jgi:hypothetical protein
MISNPFEGNNLAGICQILKNTYSKASLLSFNKDFSDTLHCSISEQDTLMNPVKAVQAVDLLVGQWTTMEYWKFMTSDIFFVNILLGALHSGSELKRKCVTEVNQYLAKREAGEISDDASVSDGGTGSAFGAMPVYVHLCEFLRREQESLRYGANTAAPAAGVKTPAKHSPYVRPDYRRSGNTESAASADIALLKTLAAPELEMKCTCVVTGKEFSYTATKEACTKCHGAGASAGERHKMKCYSGTCRQCGLYGHKNGNCRQDPSTWVIKKVNSAAGTAKG